MESNKIITFTTVSKYLKLNLWIIVLAMGGYFLVKDALPYFAFEEDHFGRYWPSRWSLIGHISCGVLALVIGPFQFWKNFRTKKMSLHRLLGKIYLIAILIGSISAVHLATTLAMDLHWTWALALLSLALVWMVTAGMAYYSIRKKRISEHQEWMTKSYVVTFAFVTFRFINDLPAVGKLGNFIETGPAAI